MQRISGGQEATGLTNPQAAHESRRTYLMEKACVTSRLKLWFYNYTVIT
jgi:hypothetical protein